MMLPYGRWHLATKVVIRFRGNKGDREQRGSLIVRTRDECRGPRSEVDAGGGAVAVLVELLSVHPALPRNAALSSVRCGGSVAAWQYSQALKAMC